MVVKTVLDSRELAFLIRQIDEYIQVMEVLIRKTPALDTGELALARNLKKELLVGKQAGLGERALPKSLARRRSAGIDDGVPRLGQVPQCGRSLVPQRVLAPARLCSMPSACVTSRNIQNSFAECGATSSRSRR